MVGWPSQAHEVAMIHAGVYSVFIYGTAVCLHATVTVCVGVKVCVYSLCVFSL